MKNYIHKIISLFTSSSFEKQTTEITQQWLIDDEHNAEKDTALKTIWDKTESVVDDTLWESLDQVYEKIGISNVKRKSSFSIHKLIPYAAAIALIILSVSSTYLYLQSQQEDSTMVELYTEAGKRNTILLPDGSTVQTNSETLLLYANNFEGQTRTVYLIGEANFQVAKDPNKPFIVKASNVSITALGTEFNVNAYPDNNEVVASLLSGKVKVLCGNDDSNTYIMTPGEQFTYAKNTHITKIEQANMNDVIALQSGSYVFRAKTLQEIFTTLERRYNMTLQYNMNSFSSDKYNFSFGNNSSLSEILDIMKEVVGGFDYRIENDTCIIKSTSR